MSTLTYAGELTILTCWCGIRHAVPEELRRYQLREHNSGRSVSVWCPLGHQHVPSGKSEAQRLRERADSLESQLANKDEDLRSTRASLIVTKGHMTRLRKRVSAGKCPWCSEQFPDLAGHVATEHPDCAAASP